MIRTKNPIGFELLYARYYRLLFSTAYAVLRQESDAMDAVQNAALRLYTMDESLFPSDHELAWLPRQSISSLSVSSWQPMWKMI